MGRKIKLIEQLESWTQELQELKNALEGYECLELSYENDIQNDPIKALNKVTAFLDLPRIRNPIVNLKQSTPFPLKDFVEDFDLVTDMLKGTSFEHMTKSK